MQKEFHLAGVEVQNSRSQEFIEGKYETLDFVAELRREVVIPIEISK